jgi:adenine-specific DNA-methyltransferase
LIQVSSYRRVGFVDGLLPPADYPTEQPVGADFDCATSLHLFVESGFIGLGDRPDAQLSEKEKQELKDLIDRGESLPAKYRHILFSEPHEAELIWPGKTHEVTNVILPFQSIEQIDEPRSGTAAAQSDLFQMDRSTGRQSGGWTNKLIWGDNKLVLSSLKNGPLRREIERAGGLKLIYIDPPFDLGADFSFDIEVGGEGFTKEPSVIEDIAYRDTWGRGLSSYVQMIYERLVTMRDLLASDGAIYVHIEPDIGNLVRVILDEVFGADNLRTEICWKRTSSHGNVSRSFGEIWESIYYYTKSHENWIWNQQFVPFEQSYIESHFTGVDADGRKWTTSDLVNPGVRPNLTYEYKGYKPHKNGWKISREKMEEYDRQGKLYFPKELDGRKRAFPQRPLRNS